MSFQLRFSPSVFGGRFFFGVLFQPPAPISAAHLLHHRSQHFRNKGQTPNEAEEERLPPARLGLLGLKGARLPEREGSSISFRRGAAVLRDRSSSAQGEGGREATNLPGNVSSDWHLPGKQRRRGKSGDESSSYGGGERCGEPGATGCGSPLASYSGCSALILSLPCSLAKPNLVRKLRVCMSVFLTQ